MASNPINLGVRFLLELISLVILGYWGWGQGQGVFRYVLAIGIPLLAAILWGTFAVPNDPSRSGKSPVPTPGMIRLILELAYFGFAVWALASLQSNVWAWIMGAIVLLHYVISYDRVLWLLEQKSPTRSE